MAAPATKKSLESLVREFLGSGWKRIDLRLVNVLLLAVILALSAYLVIQIVTSAGTLSAMSKKGHALAGLAQAGAGFKDIASIRGLTYYTDKVGQRNIFKRGAKVGEERKPEDQPSSKAAELLASFRLVGISWSDDPDAMVEDTRTTQTFFIKKGQSLGEFKVDSIYKDKVVLRYNKEVVELK